MRHKNVVLALGILLLSGMAFSATQSQVAASPETNVFAFQQKVILDGSPETVYDYATGDISEWWDHSFSKKPYRLFIEAKPGGGFMKYSAKMETVSFTRPLQPPNGENCCEWTAHWDWQEKRFIWYASTRLHRWMTPKRN